uniref:ATP synthase F0 subunit 8 n=1 Tax=Curtos fulvocapitalis TaxID=1753970 RepID=UPI001D025015|nr:ATP synthase F0 subunit 8 [Curtos fulvocapitalis]QVG61302.1 ATP synthase F0 subunit 8 [Curtos fulvocapitalis]
MPQMAPLFWMNLFITFIMIFIMFNILNYFSLIYYKNKNINFSKKNKITFWKW